MIRVIKVVKMLWTREAQPSGSTTNFDPCDDALNHISICFFFTTISTSKKLKFLFSERELKKTLRDTLTRAALSGLLLTKAN